MNNKLIEFLEGEELKQQIMLVAPEPATVTRLLRVARSTILSNPALQDCTHGSIAQSLITCAQAGLEPDGRNAHLIPFKGVCSVIFDWKGLVALALRGDMKAVYAEVVCEHDQFRVWVEDGRKRMLHEPAWGGNGRGKPVAVYAVAINKHDIFDCEVMPMSEVEELRKQSRSGNSIIWKAHYLEMAKKCPIRRMSKRWDLMPNVYAAMYADFDTPEPLHETKVVEPVFTAPPKEIVTPADASATVEDAISAEDVTMAQVERHLREIGFLEAGETYAGLSPEKQQTVKRNISYIIEQIQHEQNQESES